MAIFKGEVKFYNETKSYGFITYEQGEIFVHATGLKHELKKNDKVSFEIIEGKKGLNAVNVKVIH
jgi:CspA family cold shock protein